MPHTRESRLEALLLDLFPQEIELFVSQHYGENLAQYLPQRGTVPAAKYTNLFIEGLTARGLINHELFQALLEERPGRRKDIAAHALAWKCALPPERPLQTSEAVVTVMATHPAPIPQDRKSRVHRTLLVTTGILLGYTASWAFGHHLRCAATDAPDNRGESASATAATNDSAHTREAVDAGHHLPDDRLVTVGSGSVRGYLQCYAPVALSTAEPLVLDGGSVVALRLLVSAFHHGVTTADTDRPGLLALVSHNPKDLLALPSIPGESRDAKQNRLYFAKIADNRPISIYFRDTMKSRVDPNKPLGKPCRIDPSQELAYCIDIPELYRWIYDDIKDTRIGVPGSNSATRTVLDPFLCEHQQTLDPDRKLKCSATSLSHDLPRAPSHTPFDLAEELIPRDRDFFYVGSELIPDRATDQPHEPPCGPTRKDIRVAQLCRSVEGDKCINPMVHSFFVVGKWSVSGKEYVMQKSECNFIRSVAAELKITEAEARLKDDCVYPISDDASPLTQIF